MAESCVKSDEQARWCTQKLRNNAKDLHFV